MNDLSSTRSGAGRLLLGGLAYVFLALVPLSASAGVAYQAPAYSGVTSGIYKGASPVVSGAISTPATLNLAGRSITVPASARIAANAATYAVSAVRLNPYVLLGTAAAAWLLTASLTQQPDGSIAYQPPAETINTNNMTAEQAQALINSGGYYYFNSAGYSNCLNTQVFQTSYWYLVDGGAYVDLYCMTQYGSYMTHSWVYNPYQPTNPAPIPATDQHFVPLEQAPLPDAVADELADNLGIPVDRPQVAPGDVAIGAPYRKPDGSWSQPRAKITPMPDGTAAISPYEVPVDAPLGEPAPQPDYIPQGDPALAGTETQPDPCLLNPDRAGCASLGEPVDQPVDQQAQVMSITPVPVSMPGVCPAPKQVVTPFGTIALSYDPACQFAGMIRPVVLALGLFAASMIFVGGLRNG